MRQITLLWLMVAVLAAACVLNFVRVQDVQAHQNDALHSILCHAEQVVRTQPGIPEAKRKAALKFYQQSLSDAHLKPCEQGGT